MSTTNSVPGRQTALREQIHEFILQNLAEPKGISSFNDDDHLMETGLVDSLGIFRLVSFIEEDLGVRVDDQEINIDTLKTVNTIEELVLRKRAAK